MLARPRPVHWYTVPVRVVLLTFIGTLLSFAVSLLVGIVVTVALSMQRHVNPDMRAAYRHVALPMALIAGGVVLISASVMEVRHYRQSKALAAIARASQPRPLQTQP